MINSPLEQMNCQSHAISEWQNKGPVRHDKKYTSAGTPVSGIRVKENIPFNIVLSGQTHHFDYSQDSTWCYQIADRCVVFSDGPTFLFLSILVSSWFISVGQIVKAKIPTSLFSTSRPCYKQFKHRLSGSRILWRYSLLYLKQYETGLLNFFFFFDSFSNFLHFALTWSPIDVLWLLYRNLENHPFQLTKVCPFLCAP